MGGQISRFYYRSNTNIIKNENINPNNIYQRQTTLSEKDMLVQYNNEIYKKFTKSKYFNSFSFILVIKYSDLKEAFNFYAVDRKYLDFEKFNNVITSVFKFDIPIICHSYLSEKLFNLLSKVYFR